MSMKIKQRLHNNTNDYLNIKRIFESNNNISLNSFPYESILKLNMKFYNTGLSIIIPCWNTQDIVFTLKSIELSTFNKKFHNLLEVIIVDDGSDIPVKQILSNKRFHLNTKLMRQKHLGRAYAINTGVSYASYENIIFCDSDIIFSPTTIEQLATRISVAHNSILFGFRSDVERPCSYYEFIKLFNKTPEFYEDNRFKYDFSKSWSTNMMQETNFLQSYPLKTNFWVSDEKTSIDDCWQSFRMVYGFLFTTTKTIFKTLGGFDERLSGWGWDDSIYCAKALSLGIPIIPVSAAYCSHIKHPYRTKDQWGECAKNFKIVKKTLNSNKYLHFDEIKDNRINYVQELKKKDSATCIYNYKENIIKSLKSNMFLFLYYYNIAEYKMAVEAITSETILSEEHLNLYLDCLIRLKDKIRFNKISSSNKKCSNCFNYYISEIFFNNNFNLQIPKNPSTNNFLYLYKISKKEHKRRGQAFYKEKLYYLAFKDYCASYLLGMKTSKPKILKLRNILMKNQ